MTEAEKIEFAQKLGAETTAAIANATKGLEEKAKLVAESVVKNGGVDKELFATYQAEQKAAVEAVTEIARKQGMTITELQMKATGIPQEGQSLEALMAADKDAFAKGEQRTYMVYTDKKNNQVAVNVLKANDGGYKVVDKAVGPNASIAGVAGAGNDGSTALASITSALSTATILRMGADADFNSIYRNSMFLFDQLNIINAGIAENKCYWMDETAPVGTSAPVAEGGSKPFVQHFQVLRSADYLTQACVYEFTNQYNLDFSMMQDRILTNGSIDLMNKIQDAVLVKILAATTAFSAGNATSFKQGTVVANVNDFDALCALKATAKNNTFGSSPNTALMSTFKEGRIGAIKDSTGQPIALPNYLADLKMAGNPIMADDNVIVGDFKQYNVQFRGGMIVRAGLNGNNLIENKFTVVQEQMYWDWISEVRKVALVKGTTFAAVKTAIST